MSPSDDDDSYATLRPDQPLRVDRKDEAPISDEDMQTLHGGATSPASPIQSAVNDLSDAEFSDDAAETASKPAPPPPNQSLKAGSQFGDYEVIEEIDRGGMGVVIKARQKKLNRVVAIKMILTGNLANDADVKRFYTEAEASAELDHPYIVPIYEIGEVDGLHFYSMRYVDGPSLSARVVDGPLEVDEAALLSQHISEAVSYAHERGIIHRDLKPANILLDDGTTPLITDFGLAKRLDDDQGLTGTGQVIGTPGYMPPEQALGNVREIDRASDIYSLGAILYCLLTGRAPFHAASIMETLNQVIKNDPVPPRQLNPAVPVDLETVCLKCLGKQPAQRYESAQDVADDLERYLDGRPVLARPVGGLQRFVRWCKRNPVVAALGMTAATFLVAGTVVSTMFAFEAAERAREAEREFVRAEANSELAIAAVDKFFTQVSENTLLNQPGMQPLRKELLSQALDYYEQFLIENADDEGTQDELADAQFRVGLINETVEADATQAISPLTKALRIQEDLVKTTPDDPDRLRALANTLTALGRIQFRNTGPESALDTLSRALDIRQQIAASPDGSTVDTQRVVANGQMNLGLVYMNLGQFEEAKKHFDQAQSIRTQILVAAEDARVRRDLGMGFYNLGNLSLSNPAAEDGDAFQNFQAAIDVFTSIAEAEPQDFSNQSRLAFCYRIVGDLQSIADDLAPALASYDMAGDSLQHLVDLNPSVTQYRDQLANVLMNHGQLLVGSGLPDEALAKFQKSMQILTELRESDSGAPSLDGRYAVVLREIGLIQIQNGDTKTGFKNFNDAEALQQELVKNNPNDESLKFDLEDTQSLRPDVPSE